MGDAFRLSRNDTIECHAHPRTTRGEQGQLAVNLRSEVTQRRSSRIVYLEITHTFGRSSLRLRGENVV